MYHRSFLHPWRMILHPLTGWKLIFSGRSGERWVRASPTGGPFPFSRCQILQHRHSNINYFAKEHQFNTIMSQPNGGPFSKCQILQHRLVCQILKHQFNTGTFSETLNHFPLYSSFSLAKPSSNTQTFAFAQFICIPITQCPNSEGSF